MWSHEHGGIKYVNFIEITQISPVDIEIWGVENGDLAVPVNNTMVYHTSFLAGDTRLCVLKSRVYGGHKICKFDRNQSSSYRDWKQWLSGSCK